LANYLPGVEDFTGNSKSGFYGAAVGITFPSTQNDTYGIVKVSGWGFTGSTDLFSAASGTTARTNWAASFDMGLGKTIYDKVDLYGTIGPAIADQQVDTPFGRANKISWSYTGEIGVVYKIDPLWSMKLAARAFAFQETNFNTSPGVNIPVRNNIIMYMVGFRRVIGSTETK
jgi:opacity protein-like surface antigen